MMDLVFKKLELTAESKDGMYPIFTFAIDDYKAKYGISSEALKDFWIFGAILDKSDDSYDFFAFMDSLRKAGNIRLFVFDINYISGVFVNKLKRQFESDGQYEELVECYEDRIVFGFKEELL